MRWWLRTLGTLAVAPVVWQAAAIYIGSTQGGTVEALLAAAPATLVKIYAVYTLPALALIAVVLLPADRLLSRLGADLLIVGVAPLLAVLVALLVSHVDPRLDAAGLVGLAFAYGLVFGLTVREPPARARQAAPEDQHERA